MSDLDVGHRRGSFLDCLEEVRPEKLEIVPVRLLQLGILMNHLGGIIGGIKRPAILPADVQRTLRTVEVGANAVLLRFVLRKTPMFPHAGERRKLVHCHLMVRRVRRLFLLRQYGGTGNGTSSGGIDLPRRFFPAPPQHLIKPMHPPVAQLAVAVIQEVAPTAGVNLAVERPQRRRTAPKVPVHSLRRSAVQRRFFASTSAMSEQTNHSHFTHRSRFQEVHRVHVVRTDPPMQSDLHDFARRLCRLKHRPAFRDAMSRGLFDENVRTGLYRRDSLERMPMIRRGNKDQLGLLAIQHLPVVSVQLRLVSVQILDLFRRNLPHSRVHIAQGDHLDPAAGDRFAQNVHSPPTGADQRRAILTTGVGRPNEGGGGQQRTGGHGTSDKLPAIEGRGDVHSVGWAHRTK